MLEMIAFLMVFVLILIPTPNITTSYIRLVGVLVCVLFLLVNFEWQILLDFLVKTEQVYRNFVMQQTNSDVLTRSIISFTCILIVQPIVIAAFLIIRKKILT